MSTNPERDACLWEAGNLARSAGIASDTVSMFPLERLSSPSALRNAEMWTVSMPSSTIASATRETGARRR
jgi:hypothetical protein